jgi:NAD-dependent deacetylase sirtuin 2
LSQDVLARPKTSIPQSRVFIGHIGADCTIEEIGDTLVVFLVAHGGTRLLLLLEEYSLRILLRRARELLGGSVDFRKNSPMRLVGQSSLYLGHIRTHTMATAAAEPALSLATRRILADLRSGRISKVAVLNGAGISVPSGIPDFRSAGGLYDTLRPELLTATPAQRSRMARDPTAVVDWAVFKDNSLPYLEVRRPFILGTYERRWRPTVAHGFFALLARKGLLTRVYTQNIDGQQELTSLPPDRIVHVHGSIDRAACEHCGAAYPFEGFVAAVRSDIKDIYAPKAGATIETAMGAGAAAIASDGAPAATTTAPAPAAVPAAVSTPIACKACGKAGVKPCTVLYGRSLPDEFFARVKEDFPASVDMLIVAGTSLTVGPANTLPLRVAPGTPRLVVNRDRVGEDLGLVFDDAGDVAGADTGADAADTAAHGGVADGISDADASPRPGGDTPRDAFVGGDCDAAFVAIARELGWLDELRGLAASGDCDFCPASRAALGLA